ncbi:MAG: choice-of-anchor J domain-containing protein [Bacteroidales bacterium]|nr:choice-of-anchor J domain-containing protein [Bacteroidales bacterium]
MRLKTIWKVLLMALLLPASLRAQDSLQVCNGTTENSYLPIYGYYNDSRFRNEFIYPARMLSEMAGSVITQITFYAEDDESWTSNLVLRLAEVNDTAFNSSDPWKLPADADNVWTGTCSVVNGRWVISLDSPYLYTGDNLLVDIMNTAVGTGCPFSYFLGVSTTYYAAGMFSGSTAATATTISNRAMFLPKATFHYSASGANICLRPTGLTASDVSADEATLSWHSRNGESSWLVLLNDSVVATVSDSTYTFTNLNSNTPYTAGVMALCDDGDTSNQAFTAFRTLCDAISILPWNENFNSYTGASGAAASASISNIPCWDFLGTYEPYSFLQNSYNHDTAASGNVMRLYGNTNNYPTFVILPPFQEPLSNLLFGFWMHTDNANTRLGIGYMSNPADTSTYTEVATVAPATLSNWEYMETTFGPNASGRITLRYYGNYNNIRLDDFTVMEAPSCSRPSAIAVAGITSDEAQLHILDTINNAMSYTVVLSNDTAVVDSVDIYDTLYTFYNLVPNSNYTVSMTANCYDGSSYNPMTASFHTACVGISHDSLPFTEGFESYTASSYAISSSRMDIPCWSILNRQSENYPYISTSQHHSGSNSAYIYSYSDPSTATVIALPNFEDDLQYLMLSFWLYNNAVQVGVLNNLSDATSFVPLTTCTPATSGTWEQFEVTFPNQTTGAIAIRYAGTDYGSCYIDDITVQELPTCTRPSSVVAANVSTTEADIVINDATYTNHYMLYLNSTDSIELYDTIYTLTDLTPNTAYTVSVRTICSDGSMTEPVTISFRTECDVINTLPWQENFDSYTDLAIGYTSGIRGGMIPCWGTILNNSNALMSLTSSSYRYGTSGLSLLFYPGQANIKNYIILPSFSEDISNLELQFQTRPEGTSSSSGSFDVGYITDPTDSTTFVSVQHYDYSDFSGNYQQKFVTFANAPSGARIAMRHNSAASNYYWFVDEVEVHYAPTCSMPVSVSIAEATSTSITASVTDTISNTYIYQLLSGTTIIDSAFTSDTSWIFENLSPNHLYTINVRTVCPDGSYTAAATTSGRTSCAMLTTDDLPFVEDFEETPSSSANIPCWTRNSYSTTYPNYPQVYSATGHNNSSHVLYFYTNQASQFMALPEVDDLSNLMLSFYARALNSSYNYHLSVGAMTDPNDTTTFTTLQTITPTNTWELYEVDLGSYTDTGHYVAFRYYLNTYGGLYIDDVNLDVAPLCARPAQVVARNIMPTSASLFIDDYSAGNNYTVVLSDGTNTDTIHATDTIVGLTGLTPNTTYTVSVIANCSDGSSRMPVNMQFSTPCLGISTLPWTENFDSLATNLTNNLPCWGYIANGNSNSRVIVTDATSRTHSSPKSLRFSGYCSQPNFVVLPYFNDSISSLVLRLWLVAENGTNSGQLRVGYLTDPGDSSTFVPTAVFDAADYLSYQQEQATFAGAPAGARIAISQLNNGNNYWWWIDDIEVDHVPNCIAPVLSVSNITDSSATISITDANNSNHYWLHSSPTDSVEVIGNSHTFTGLTPNTAYAYTARTICSATELSSSAAITFRTSCGLIAHEMLPWTEDFESHPAHSYGNDTTVFNEPCWTILNRYSSYYPYVCSNASYVHSGNKALYLYSNYSPATVIALPTFADSLSSLSFSFWMKVSSTYYSYDMEVGYLTNSGSASSFVAVDTCHNTSSDYTFYEVRFPEGATGNIALRYLGYYSGTVYLDDFSVIEAPLCSRPSSVTVANVTSYSAEVNVSDPENTNHYWVVLNGTDSTELTGNMLSLTGLTPATSYTVAVSAICSDGSITSAATTSFQTACGEITTFPWSENFDEIPYGTYNIYTGAYLPCWNMMRGRYNDSTGTANTYPANSDVFYRNNYGMNGSTNLRCNIYGDTNYRWLVTPTFALNTAAEFSFHYSLTVYNSNDSIEDIGNDDRFLVLVTTNDGNTWTPLYTFGHGSDYDVELADVANTPDSVTIDLSQYAGYSIRIAFYGESLTSDDGDNDFHIDNLSLVITGVPPTQHTVTLLTADSTMGSVSPAGATTVTENNSFTATATANEGYHFVSWTDGTAVVSTENPYTFIVTDDVTLTATFEQDIVRHAVTLTSADSTMGFVTPSGTTLVPEGERFTARASANNGYRFDAWTDGTNVVTTENPYTFTVSEDVTLTATFIQLFRVEVEYNAEIGYVTGNGVYDAGSEVTLTATADPGFAFFGWVPAGTTDTVTTNPYTFIITSDTNLNALFGPVVGIAEAEQNPVTLFPNPATTSVTLSGLDEGCTVSILDLNGRSVFRTTAADSTLNVDLKGFAQGAYFVRLTGAKGTTVRKLVVK